MKTLYLTAFCNAALEAIGKKPHSLECDVSGDDLRVIASMLDIATMYKEKIEIENLTTAQKKPPKPE